MRHIAHYPGQHVHPMLAKQGASIMDQQSDGQDKNRSSDGYAIIVMYLTATEGVYDSGYTQESAAAAISMARDEGRYQELLEDARAWLSSDKTSSRKTAVNFDFGDLTTINPDTGRFRSVVPEGGNPKYRGYNILELLEDALDNAVSFTPMVSYEEPTTVSVTCVESGWSASVDASKEGWGLRLLEQAEAHDDDYMGKWLDENSDFSGYRASRKTATGEMSEADLTPDGEWGFWVQVADAVGGTIHPFDKYQGPYIRYNGNRFWLHSDETGDFVYNETTDELRPIFESVGGGLQFSFVPAAVAEEIRDMARTGSRKRGTRKTAEISSFNY